VGSYKGKKAFQCLPYGDTHKPLYPNANKAPYIRGKMENMKSAMDSAMDKDESIVVNTMVPIVAPIKAPEAPVKAKASNKPVKASPKKKKAPAKAPTDLKVVLRHNGKIPTINYTLREKLLVGEPGKCITAPIAAFTGIPKDIHPLFGSGIVKAMEKKNSIVALSDAYKGTMAYISPNCKGGGFKQVIGYTRINGMVCVNNNTMFPIVPFLKAYEKEGGVCNRIKAYANIAPTPNNMKALCATLKAHLKG